MDNTTRFNTYITALQQYITREGHCRVPAVHIEILDGVDIKLGSFCSYARQRCKKNMLLASRMEILNGIPGWEWGPFKPGPTSNTTRNVEIRSEYTNGRSLADLATKFDLSRQRVHQIVGKHRSHASV